MPIVNVTKCVKKTILFCHYPGQTNQQPCYIELDCEDGDLFAAYNAEIGGAVPFAVHEERRLRWAIPCLTAEAANDVLDQIEPYAQEVLDGFDLVWDGSNQVGRFSRAAQEARNAIEAICDDAFHLGEEVSAWPARDYFLEVDHEEVWCKRWGLTAETTDTELAEIDTRIRVEEADQVDILTGLGDFLEELRAVLREEVRDGE